MRGHTITLLHHVKVTAFWHKIFDTATTYSNVVTSFRPKFYILPFASLISQKWVKFIVIFEIPTHLVVFFSILKFSRQCFFESIFVKIASFHRLERCNIFQKTLPESWKKIPKVFLKKNLKNSDFPRFFSKAYPILAFITLFWQLGERN